MTNTNKFSDIIFEEISLTPHVHHHVRGKPKNHLLHAIELFKKFTSHKVILEIGSIRLGMNHSITEFDPVCCNDGHSTFFWKEYTDAEIHTVDIDPHCKHLIESDERLTNINSYTQDAIVFGKEFARSCNTSDKRIDLLFLDAWDVEPNTPYAEKHLEIYTVLKESLSDDCLILIDDTDIGNGGKGRLVIPCLIEDGFELLVTGRQTLLIRRKLLNIEDQK